MNELLAPDPTNTTLAFTLGAAIMSAQLPSYPQRAESYEVRQEVGTYSPLMNKTSAQPSESMLMAQQVSAIFSSFAERQERLGAEFEAAVFSNLEALYEA